MITTINEAREIVNRCVEKAGDMKGRISSVEFRNRLNKAFESDRIIFKKVYASKEEWDFYGGSCDTTTKRIEVYLNKRYMKNILKFYKQNREEFKEEIFKILIHELKHRHQFSSVKKSKIIGNEYEETLDYYADHYEIDAYAQDVAMFLGIDDEARCTMDIYKLFKNDKPKVYKRFLKKMYKYMVELNLLEE